MINRVVLVGRLTKNAELKSTATGKSVVNFTLAVQSDRENADFINCVAWGRTAEVLSQYTSSGSLIAIDGRLKVRSYDSNGVTKYSTEVICDSLTLCDSKTKDKEETINKQYRYESPLSITEEDLPF